MIRTSAARDDRRVARADLRRPASPRRAPRLEGMEVRVLPSHPGTPSTAADHGPPLPIEANPPGHIPQSGPAADHAARGSSDPQAKPGNPTPAATTPSAPDAHGPKAAPPGGHDANDVGGPAGPKAGPKEQADPPQPKAGPKAEDSSLSQPKAGPKSQDAPPAQPRSAKADEGKGNDGTPGNGVGKQAKAELDNPSDPAPSSPSSTKSDAKGGMPAVQKTNPGGKSGEEAPQSNSPGAVAARSNAQNTDLKEGSGQSASTTTTSREGEGESAGLVAVASTTAPPNSPGTVGSATAAKSIEAETPAVVTQAAASPTSGKSAASAVGTETASDPTAVVAGASNSTSSPEASSGLTSNASSTATQATAVVLPATSASSNDLLVPSDVSEVGADQVTHRRTIPAVGLWTQFPAWLGFWTDGASGVDAQVGFDEAEGALEGTALGLEPLPLGLDRVVDSLSVSLATVDAAIEGCAERVDDLGDWVAGLLADDGLAAWTAQVAAAVAAGVTIDRLTRRRRRTWATEAARDESLSPWALGPSSESA